ncbi:TPA: ANR family transcriptional regulator [Salmonella enterica subsp. enterica serovar Birkenhead]
MFASISGLVTAISMCRSPSTLRRCDMANVNDRARNTYHCYAVGAIRCEQAREYRRAAVLWFSASERPCKAADKRWAECRAAFCRRAATGRWGKPGNVIR